MKCLSSKYNMEEDNRSQNFFFFLTLGMLLGHDALQVNQSLSIFLFQEAVCFVSICILFLMVQTTSKVMNSPSRNAIPIFSQCAKKVLSYRGSDFPASRFSTWLVPLYGDLNLPFFYLLHVLFLYL